MRLRVFTVLCILVLASIPGNAAAYAEERNPVVFVHGYNGSGQNWDSMIQEFVQAGWDRDELVTIDYTSDVSNSVIAEQVGEAADEVLAETGKSRVDVVAHSMGSLSSRWYIKFLGGQDTVDNWVSLGGPNNGSVVRLPCVATSPACAEVVQGSSFLATLNADDPTPGEVTYTTFRSPCDFLILPRETVSLPGAENNVTGCVGHISLVTDDGVTESVIDTLD